MSALTNTLIEEIKTAPEPLQRELFDFLVRWKTRAAAGRDGGDDRLPLAQSAWAADWNTPEEDEARRDLKDKDIRTRPSFVSTVEATS